MEQRCLSVTVTKFCGLDVFTWLMKLVHEFTWSRLVTVLDRVLDTSSPYHGRDLDVVSTLFTR